MRRSRTGLIAVAALAALTVAACSSSDKTASPTTNPATTVGEVTTTTTAETPTTPAATGPTTVAVAPTALGMILVDSKGMTLYIDENDQPGAPACTEACLGAWPPLKAPASPTFAAALDPSKFSTATAADGTKQLAVNEFPLYYFTNDKKPGDVTGQDSGGFYVVGKDGNKVEASAE
jgi:predicted lipoprotein with Yx(FWY)xxD motif